MILSCEWRILQAPVQTIASNAGVEGAVIAGKLLEQENTDLGYDAAKGRVHRLVTLILGGSG